MYDDFDSVVNNPHIRQLWPLRETLSAPQQSPVAGRPIVGLSLAINYAIGGLSPFGYHAWNVAIHLFCGLLLFGILRRTFSLPTIPSAWQTASAPLALACALIWLVHPLQSEVVEYVTQRTESMMGLFYLLTLYAAIRCFSSREHPGRWAAAAVAACAFGMASKESMVTSPIVVLLYDAVFVTGSFMRALRERRWLYLGLAATWMLLAALVAPGPRWRSAGFASGISPWTYLLNQSQIILTYLGLALWPDPLVFDYGLARSTTLLAVLPAAVLILMSLGATALAWMKWPTIAFAGTWFWITLAPSSSILPIATEVGAERRMYLPLAAIVVLAVLGIETLRRRFAANVRWVPVTALVVACLTLGWLTMARNREYQSELGLWQTVLERRPHGRAHYNLGLALRRTGRNSEAIEHWRTAIAEEPRAHYALALEHEKVGQTGDAAREYQAYLQKAPDDLQVPEAQVRLGVVLTALDRLDEAMTSLETALSMRPRNPDTRLALGHALMRRERYQEAAGRYAEYIQMVDNNPLAFASLGLALIAQHREIEAIPPLTRAVELQPNDGTARLSLGNVLSVAGRLEEAIVQYRHGIELVPESPALHQMLAGALIRVGRHQEALVSLERALTLRPDDAEMKAAQAQLSRAVHGSSIPNARP